MEMSEDIPTKKSFRLRWYHLLLGVCFSTIFAFLLAFWWLKSNFYAKDLKPVKLDQEEQVVLDKKIERLQSFDIDSNPSDEKLENGNYPVYSDKPLEAEPLENEKYSEEGAIREIILSERELNSMIADNPDLAEKVAIDLSKDLLSLKLIVPLDEDLLVVGGKTLKLKAGIKLAYADSKPVVAIQGVTLGGVPMPNAWLGGVKYENLIEEFGDQGGFWEMFSKGVEDLEVVEGGIRIKLKE